MRLNTRTALQILSYLIVITKSIKVYNTMILTHIHILMITTTTTL